MAGRISLKKKRVLDVHRFGIGDKGDDCCDEVIGLAQLIIREDRRRPFNFPLF